MGGLFKFEKVFERTAKNLKESKKDLIFARVDLKKDEIFKFKIEEIPTVFLFPKQRKEEVIEFNGDEKVSSLTEFLEKNCAENKEKAEL